MRVKTMLAAALLVTAALLAVASPASAAFEITSYDGAVLKANGDPSLQAGGHPSLATTTFHLNTFISSQGLKSTTETLRNVAVELPPGIVGNPQALPTCSVTDFSRGAARTCPVDSQVGVVHLFVVGFSEPLSEEEVYAGLFNLAPPSGTAGLFGFSILNSAPIYVAIKIRTGSDYGLTLETLGAAQSLDLSGFKFDVWGVPSEPIHDALRGLCVTDASGHPKENCATDYEGPPAAFFTLPTSCLGPLQTSLDVTTWEGGEDTAGFLSHDNIKPIPNPVGTEGCNTLDFSPSLEARPTTNVADSPSGLQVDLHVPQSDIANPDSTAEAHLRRAEVNLPAGMTVNPAGANGLGACTPAQAGFTGFEKGVAHFTPDPVACPDASKIGTVQINTPVLDHPLSGGVYIAAPHDNPFDSLLALYIGADDYPHGNTVVKLAGKASLDPVTGRLTATFDENPQMPFEDLKLSINGGAAAPLRTPELCGTYTTTSELTPWSAPESGPPAAPSDSYAIEQGAIGGNCPRSSSQRPNSPSFDAGTVAPLAGKDSPLVVNLRREDGSQQLSSVKLSPPPGLIGKLAGIPYCPESALADAAAKTGTQEKANPSCPAASEVGGVVASAGAGPAPYNAPGKVYLTGPYKGAPLSFAIVTPAVAGPFDLGTIVVRTALFIDPKTTQITAISDSIPSILQGIPLDLRAVQIRLDRADFTRNPTSCEPLAFTGQLLSTLGQAAPLSSRFQVGECGRLHFEPKLSLSLKGGTTRGKHPALTAVLKTREGDANLANISVALPHSEFLDQNHIGTVCTRVQFAAGNCPATSVYGQATATTPLLDYPLSGPVYLRSNPEHELPDLVPDLRGPASQPLKIEAAGLIDSVNQGIRNSFEYIPDAPLSKVVLSLPGGNKGLLENSRNLCRKTYRADVKFGAHNGLTLQAHPPLKASCGSKAKKRSHRGRRR